MGTRTRTRQHEASPRLEPAAWTSQQAIRCSWRRAHSCSKELPMTVSEDTMKMRAIAAHPQRQRRSRLKRDRSSWWP
jgi:hypothetical protein